MTEGQPEQLKQPEQPELEYYTHKWCQKMLIGLLQYMSYEFLDKLDKVPQALLDYETYLKARIQENPPSIFDLPESEYHQPDDGRYPSEQFLISLSETWIYDHNRETYDKLMRIVSDTWYCMIDSDVYDDDGRYELYTGGWSGNESIVDALTSNPSIAMMCEIDASTCVIKINYRFREDKK